MVVFILNTASPWIIPKRLTAPQHTRFILPLTSPDKIIAALRGRYFSLWELYLENFMSRLDVIPTFRQRRCKTGAGTSFGANGDQHTRAAELSTYFCVLTIRKHLLKMSFERSGRGQEPSRGHKFSILENLVLHRDFTSQTLASFDVILLGRACPKPCLERTRRNCVKLTQFLLSPCGSIGEITLGIFQRLFQKFLQLIRIIIHPMVRLRKFNIVVWNVVQNVRSH